LTSWGNKCRSVNLAASPRRRAVDRSFTIQSRVSSGAGTHRESRGVRIIDEGAWSQAAGNNPKTGPSQSVHGSQAHRDSPDTSGERPSDYRSMPTGTRIRPDIGTNGRGNLEVENEPIRTRLCGSLLFSLHRRLPQLAL